MSNTRSARLTIFAAALMLLAGGAFAQEEDAEGSKDHPIVGRYKGSYIKLYERKEFEEVRLLKPPLDVAGTGSAPLTDAFSIPLSGRSTTILYEGPAPRSVLEVLTNYITKLTAGGFKLISRCRGEECGLIGSNVWIQQLYFRGLHSRKMTGRPVNGNENDATVYALLQKQDAAGDVWVSMYGSEYTRDGEITPNLAVSVLETKPMETGNMTLVNAANMKEAIEQTGRVALYGIYFDFNKADLKAASDKQIAEIGRLLKSNPSLKVLVAGHTDSRGELAYNTELSELRAAAVVEALTAKHAIAQSRLVPVGVGMAAPIDTNKTEAGRAKNRRVEIVEYR